MHVDSSPPAQRPWYRELTGYHWFVFAVAAVAWMADCLDQQIFNLSRVMSLTDLNGGGRWLDLLNYFGLSRIMSLTDVKVWASVATSVFLVGWATGGLIFGM